MDSLRTLLDENARLLDRDGFAIVRSVLNSVEVDELRCAVAIEIGNGRMTRAGVLFAARNLLDVPAVRALSRHPSIRQIVEAVVGGDCVAVKATLFDKLDGANWKVPYHQDLTITVTQRRELSGFGPWSVKNGVNHVQPPAQILEHMVAIRVHLDDCGIDNGPLRIIPGTHSRGRMSSADIVHVRTSVKEIYCLVDEGDAIVLKPLLLHASSVATQPGHRRVIHIEFANPHLPGALEWHRTA